MADKGDWDSYFWPGTQVLLNIPGARGQETLNALEMMAAKSRTFELARQPVDGCFGLEHLRRIHQHLFQDIYEWAGELRTSPPFPMAMFKGGPSPQSIATGKYTADDRYPYRYFPAGEGMVAHLRTWFARLVEPADYAAMSPAVFAGAIAEPWGEINAAHPFREGNTRAQVAFFTQFAAARGHFLDYERFGKDEWFRAKFNAGRFLVQHNTDTSLLAEALAQVIDRRMTGQALGAAGALPEYEPHYVSEV
ncbi:MAG: Fic family protein [Bifidobacteriaceae bacterium]|nr:Fic family protein [Bifidobacteriaceae bacterium]